MRLLESLEEQSLPAEQFEVIVVDDCSGDDTQEVLKAMSEELPYRLKVRRTPENRGPGPARNIGWKAAEASIVAFVDDDCVPDPDWLSEGLKAIEVDPRLGLLQGLTRPADPELAASDARYHSMAISAPTPYFETCNIFYRREALEEVGGFGEHHNWWGGWYCEDTFGGWRVLDAGWSRSFIPDARVTHDVETRTLRWRLSKSLVVCYEIAVARRHPGFRREAFWRPWSPGRQDGFFALGVAGLLLSVLRWRPAALLLLPYLLRRRPSLRKPRFVASYAEAVAIDSARFAGILYGALRYRIFVI